MESFMPSADAEASRPVRRLTFFYVTALGAVALLLLASQVVVQYQLSRQSTDALTVNLAGRQRALSQKISKLALILAQKGEPDAQQARLDELKGALDLYKQTQAGLQQGSPEQDLPGNLSPRVQGLFEAIQPSYSTISSSAQSLLVLPATALTLQDGLDLETAILGAEPLFYQGMDRIVFALQEESMQRVRNLKRIEWALCGLALLVLLSEALLIYRPATRKLAATLGELVHSRAEYRRVVEEAAEGIHQVSPEGRLLAANPAMVRICGYGSERELLDAAQDVRTGLYLDAGRYDRLVRSLELQGALYTEESQIRCRDSSTIWVSQSLRPVLDGSGRLLHYEGAVIDITRRKLAEEDLHKALEQLIEINHEKEELMGIAAHDLRNPLTAVLSSAEFVVDNPEIPRFEIDGHCRQIIRQTERMANLVKRLLDANQIERGQIEVKRIPCDIVQLVRSLVETHRPGAVKKGQEITYAADTEPVIIPTDQLIVIQILDNLISNAIKYSPHGKRISVLLRASSDRCSCEVRDEGPGISAEDREKLFGKFARLSAQPTGGESSTGLGLSIVKRLSELIGANVRCESEPGNGAAFIVEFSDSPVDGRVEV